MKTYNYSHSHKKKKSKRPEGKIRKKNPLNECDERTGCSLCGLEYQDETQLRRHINQRHGDYIRTISKLQSSLHQVTNNIEKQQPLIINDETFEILQKMEETKVEKKEIKDDDNSVENHSTVRRSNRIRKPANYQEHSSGDDQIIRKSTKKSKRKPERPIEVITLDSESDTEESLEKSVRAAQEEDVTAVEVTPLVPVPRESSTSTHTTWGQGGGGRDRHVELQQSLECNRCVATIIFQTETALTAHNLRRHQLQW